MEIHSIYDNQGETFDRYTVYYTTSNRIGTDMMDCRGMSEDPFNEIGQMSNGMPGEHNGKEITFEDLPEKCQEQVTQDLSVEYKRNPTAHENRFGYGCTHYRSFKRSEVTKDNGDLKAWFKADDDGMRYYL